MQTRSIERTDHTLGLLLALSWDRLLYGAAVGAALFGAAWLISVIA